MSTHASFMMQPEDRCSIRAVDLQTGGMISVTLNVFDDDFELKASFSVTMQKEQYLDMVERAALLATFPVRSKKAQIVDNARYPFPEEV